MSDEKEIRWMGSAYDDLLAFPDDPRRSAGFQLGKSKHCFQKKTQATSKQDKGIAEARYRAVVNARKVRK
ncbi:MAG: hypothetical protein HY028_03235 [Gammaproteobacteria bacterium]|nr:hypothetical protein [Gammaproteobacteria bacterium]